MFLIKILKKIYYLPCDFIRKILSKFLQPSLSSFLSHIITLIIIANIISGIMTYLIIEGFEDKKDKKEEKSFFGKIKAGLSDFGGKMDKVKDAVTKALEDKNSEKFAPIN